MNRGFSLLELIVYLGIVSILSVVLVAVFFSINKGRGGIESKTVVDSNLRLAFEKIEGDIRAATYVYTPASAGATSTSLVLQVGGSTTTYDVYNGQLRRTVLNESPEYVTESIVEVNTVTSSIPLLFTRLENTSSLLSNGKSVSIQVQMNVGYRGSSPDWQYSQTKRSTVLLRTPL